MKTMHFKKRNRQFSNVFEFQFDINEAEIRFWIEEKLSLSLNFWVKIVWVWVWIAIAWCHDPLPVGIIAAAVGYLVSKLAEDKAEVNSIKLI